MLNDTYTFTKKEAVKLALFLVQMGKVEKTVLIAKAKVGRVPSGFESQKGNIRVSWLMDRDFADGVLKSVLESDKETEENVFTPEEPEVIEKTKTFFNRD